MKPKQNEKSRKKLKGEMETQKKKKKKDPTNWNTRVIMDENVGNKG